MAGYTVIQKDRTRHTFMVREYYTLIGSQRIPSGKPRYVIETEECLTTGGFIYSRDVTKEEGNKFYTDMIEKGFKQFRNGKEISWYATIPNNTPWEEEWTTDGKYLVPIKSRVLDD